MTQTTEKDVIIGVVCAVAAALIFSSSVAVARLAVKTTLAPADLVALRFGIGGLLFLPVLIRTWTSLSATTRKAAFPLSFSHGWGMVGCSLFGLSLAPASHAAALGPGCVPLFIALLAPVFLGRRLLKVQRVGLAAITLGAGALFLGSWTSPSAQSFAGDALFLAASFLAACYLVFVEKHRVPALAGNAVVMTLSALIVLPIYFLAFSSRIPAAPASDVAVQALFQGLLMSVAYVLTHQGVLKVGGARVSIIMSSIPVLTLLMGKAVADDPIRPIEIVAVVLITFGIFFGAFLKLGKEPAQTKAADASCPETVGRRAA